MPAIFTVDESEREELIARYRSSKVRLVALKLAGRTATGRRLRVTLSGRVLCDSHDEIEFEMIAEDVTAGRGLEGKDASVTGNLEAARHRAAGTSLSDPELGNSASSSRAIGELFNLYSAF